MKKLDLQNNSTDSMQHPTYLSDDFIRQLVKFYEQVEEGKCCWRHQVSLASEDLSLWIDEPDSEQEFQVRIFNRKRLIVRRVFIKNQRRGYFSYMLLMLLRELKSIPIIEFEVESVLTPEMRAWCINNELCPIEGMHCGEDGLGASYRCSIKRLCSMLKYNLGHE